MSERNVIHNFSHEAMGTRFWIRIADEDRSYAERAAESIFYAIDELDFQVDARHDSGPLAGVNGMPDGALVAAGDHFQTLWNFSQALKEESAGAFDVTAGTLFRYWEARGTPSFNPDDAEWNKAYNDFRGAEFKLAGTEFTCVKSGAAVDFGSIIRGLAVDRIADMLENSWGIHRALIMGGGGVVLALDPPGDSNGWRIGIGKDKEMNLCRFALASKSNERQATQFVDPRTGQCITLAAPVRALASGVLSAATKAWLSLLTTSLGVPAQSPSEAEELIRQGCSRGAWLPDGTALGAAMNFDLTDRPAPTPTPESTPTPEAS
ncbi:MAG: Thiamine biosynthesis lipoprotein ApbE precursor [Verrucomicrobiota bacterium]